MRLSILAGTAALAVGGINATPVAQSKVVLNTSDTGGGVGPSPICLMLNLPDTILSKSDRDLNRPSGAAHPIEHRDPNPAPAKRTSSHLPCKGPAHLCEPPSYSAPATDGRARLRFVWCDVQEHKCIPQPNTRLDWTLPPTHPINVTKLAAGSASTPNQHRPSPKNCTADQHPEIHGCAPLWKLISRKPSWLCRTLRARCEGLKILEFPHKIIAWYPDPDNTTTLNICTHKHPSSVHQSRYVPRSTLNPINTTNPDNITVVGDSDPADTPIAVDIHWSGSDIIHDYVTFFVDTSKIDRSVNFVNDFAPDNTTIPATDRLLESEEPADIGKALDLDAIHLPEDLSIESRNLKDETKSPSKTEKMAIDEDPHASNSEDLRTYELDSLEDSSIGARDELNESFLEDWQDEAADFREKRASQAERDSFIGSEEREEAEIETRDEVRIPDAIRKFNTSKQVSKALSVSATHL
ncbi:MAG: hypothetical protein M1818_007694 [Claussenomyces sp. TS43310]|nr:MAG: hypothetical protein M1818_007694 [Claussenomyces sp. TS43310]